jgi:hypothetical protein
MFADGERLATGWARRLRRTAEAGAKRLRPGLSPGRTDRPAPQIAVVVEGEAGAARRADRVGPPAASDLSDGPTIAI